MRRCVEASLRRKPSPAAVSSQERLSEGAGRSLPFGAGDVYDIETIDIGELVNLASL